jgi:hypothetical protein
MLKRVGGKQPPNTLIAPQNTLTSPVDNIIDKIDKLEITVPSFNTPDEQTEYLEEFIKKAFKTLNTNISYEKNTFYSETDSVKQLEMYINLVKKINDTLKELIVIKNLTFHQTYLYILADDNNNVYYRIYLHYSKYLTSSDISQQMSDEDIKRMYYMYKNNSITDYIDINLLEFIKITNNNNNSDWQSTIIDKIKFHSFKSGSTLTWGSLNNVQVTVAQSSGPFYYFTVNYATGYSSLVFEGGFEGTLTFNCQPNFGCSLLSVGGGGDASNVGGNDSTSAGGGGGGIYYNKNLKFNTSSSELTINNNVPYSLSVGTNNQPTTFGANDLICYQGQNGENGMESYSGGKVVAISSYTVQPSSPAYGNVFFYTSGKPSTIFTGGNGGDINTTKWTGESGSNSELLSVTIEAPPSVTGISTPYYLGGGGAGVWVNQYGNGGNGYGGKNSSNNASNQNGYNSGYGGSYGGGGSNHGGGPRTGGPGVFAIWWKATS